MAGATKTNSKETAEIIAAKAWAKRIAFSFTISTGDLKNIPKVYLYNKIIGARLILNTAEKNIIKPAKAKTRQSRQINASHTKIVTE